jgi:dihydrofolate reductase
MHTISLIVAADEQNGIGADNKLLWHLPNDLKFFKNTTWGHPVIMGRKTFDSVGNKALPGRLNIIITSQPQTNSEQIQFASSLQEALQIAKGENTTEIFIAGGASIYELALPLANRIYFTRVHASLPAQVFFPTVNWSAWQKTFVQYNAADEKHSLAYSFEIWEK